MKKYTNSQELAGERIYYDLCQRARDILSGCDPMTIYQNYDGSYDVIFGGALDVENGSVKDVEDYLLSLGFDTNACEWYMAEPEFIDGIFGSELPKPLTEQEVADLAEGWDMTTEEVMAELYPMTYDQAIEWMRAN